MTRKGSGSMAMRGIVTGALLSLPLWGLPWLFWNKYGWWGFLMAAVAYMATGAVLGLTLWRQPGRH